MVFGDKNRSAGQSRLRFDTYVNYTPSIKTSGTDLDALLTGDIDTRQN